ncbi:unnamed protein product [Ceutorhynchus assimilis]|uniref:MBD domain-containing protein n=1 Tax=Ceutorhynchus assimilis TaxID=467358 RepID=A0A9N9ML62_9CUCU|nr:unnamed protein product [Ceutorhynchus assimilis]
MALKPDLNPTANVQNVVVYVSNDNFAQSYAVEHHQQNVPQQGNMHPSGYPNTSHPMAPMTQTKNFGEKQQIFTSSGQIVNTNTQGGYFQNVGFPIGYQNATNIKNCATNEVDRQQTGPGRPDNLKRDDCDNRERYIDPYVTILNNEVPTQSVRCDSVRSEAAESSCSSLSSSDEGMVIVQNHSSDMVVYDSSLSVRPGGVVLVAPQHAQGNALVGINQPQHTTVPYGWKRLLNNGSIIYISPSNTALSSLEQVKEYLLTSGTCKCGLECHFKYDTVFNFDPKVIAKPWVMSPDTNTGDLTKLCNHKRKIMAMASLDSKPPDLEGKMRKDLDKIKASSNGKDEIILELKEQIKKCQKPLLAEISKLENELQKQDVDLKIYEQSKQLEELNEEISDLHQQKEVLEKKMSNAKEECCKFKEKVEELKLLNTEMLKSLKNKCTERKYLV